jgi:hypothetical protein
LLANHELNLVTGQDEYVAMLDLLSNDPFQYRGRTAPFEKLDAVDRAHVGDVVGLLVVLDQRVLPRQMRVRPRPMRKRSLSIG